MSVIDYHKCIFVQVALSHPSVTFLLQTHGDGVPHLLGKMLDEHPLSIPTSRV